MITGAGLTGRSILIVEDEHLIAQLFSQFLGHWGATTVGPVATVTKRWP
jgi:hypothetical protein